MNFGNIILEKILGSLLWEKYKMFTVNEDGRNYKVEFEHGWDISEKGNGFITSVPSTDCIIFDSDTGEVLVEAEVKLNYKDQPNKDKSRKYSLGKALKTLFPNDKLTRTLFWMGYFERITMDRIRSKEQKEV